MKLFNIKMTENIGEKSLFGSRKWLFTYYLYSFTYAKTSFLQLSLQKIVLRHGHKKRGSAESQSN